MTVRPHCFVLALAMALSPAPSVAAGPEAPSPTLKERIARLALKQIAFGALSLLPVTFERSRLAGPFEEEGRLVYCVSSRMKGRSFGKPEHPKVAIRDEGGRLSILHDDEVCDDRRGSPFPELDAIGNAR